MPRATSPLRGRAFLPGEHLNIQGGITPRTLENMIARRWSSLNPWGSLLHPWGSSLHPLGSSCTHWGNCYAHKRSSLRPSGGHRYANQWLSLWLRSIVITPIAVIITPMRNHRCAPEGSLLRPLGSSLHPWGVVVAPMKVIVTPMRNHQCALEGSALHPWGVKEETKSHPWLVSFPSTSMW